MLVECTEEATPARQDYISATLCCLPISSESISVLEWLQIRCTMLRARFRTRLAVIIFSESLDSFSRLSARLFRIGSGLRSKRWCGSPWKAYWKRGCNSESWTSKCPSSSVACVYYLVEDIDIDELEKAAEDIAANILSMSLKYKGGACITPFPTSWAEIFLLK